MFARDARRVLADPARGALSESWPAALPRHEQADTPQPRLLLAVAAGRQPGRPRIPRDRPAARRSAACQARDDGSALRSCWCCRWRAASASRSCSASRCRWRWLVAGYLAWIFNLPAALALERAVPATRPRETAVALGRRRCRDRSQPESRSPRRATTTRTRPDAATPPPAEVSDIAVTPEALWVTNTARGTVLKLDRRTRRPLAPPIRVGLQPIDIAAGAGAVWVANYQSGSVLRIDPASNQLTGPIRTGRGPFGIDVGRGAVWVSNQVERTVTSIDPRTNKVVGPSPTVGRGPRGVSVGEGAVWVANGEGRSVSRVRTTGERAHRAERRRRADSRTTWPRRRLGVGDDSRGRSGAPHRPAHGAPAWVGRSACPAAPSSIEVRAGARVGGRRGRHGHPPGHAQRRAGRRARRGGRAGSPT